MPLMWPPRPLEGGMSLGHSILPLSAAGARRQALPESSIEERFQGRRTTEVFNLGGGGWFSLASSMLADSWLEGRHGDEGQALKTDDRRAS